MNERDTNPPPAPLANVGHAQTSGWRGSMTTSWLLDAPAAALLKDPTLAKLDGQVSDSGAGRWTILTGGRGHYELAAGHDPKPFIAAMEKFADEGGMISEQLWEAEDLAAAKMKRGNPTGSATPLCWAHAEYMTLVRSSHDGPALIVPSRSISATSKRGPAASLKCGPSPISPSASRKGQCYASSPKRRRKFIGVSADGRLRRTPRCRKRVSVAGSRTARGQPSEWRPRAFTFLWEEGWEGKDFHVSIEVLWFEGKHI